MTGCYYYNYCSSKLTSISTIDQIYGKPYRKSPYVKTMTLLFHSKFMGELMSWTAADSIFSYNTLVLYYVVVGLLKFLYEYTIMVK